jgi:hypothetical protein
MEIAQHQALHLASVVDEATAGKADRLYAALKLRRDRLWEVFSPLAQYVGGHAAK